MDWLGTLAQWPGAVFLRESSTAYVFANAAHIASLALLVGSIVTLDVRVLGLFANRSFSDVAEPLVRVAACGAVMAIATGLLLFSVRPDSYIQNPAFLAKVALIALGVVNAIALHLSRSWRRANAGGEVSLRAKVGAGFSIAIWMGAILAGRWIGFL